MWKLLTARGKYPASERVPDIPLSSCSKNKSHLSREKEARSVRVDSQDETPRSLCTPPHPPTSQNRPVLTTATGKHA